MLTARAVPITDAAPPQSPLISPMPSAGFSEIPPLSNVIPEKIRNTPNFMEPLPTRIRGWDSVSFPR